MSKPLPKSVQTLNVSLRRQKSVQSNQVFDTLGKKKMQMSKVDRSVQNVSKNVWTHFGHFKESSWQVPHMS